MHKKIEQVKKHLNANRVAYISGGVGILAGAAGMIVGKPATAKATQKITALVAVGNKQQLTQVAITVHRKGTLSNIVEHIETGKIYLSQNDAAKALGVDASKLSKHLHGTLSHVNGNHLRVVGDAA
jgi:hypothetical protein